MESGKRRHMKNVSAFFSVCPAAHVSAGWRTFWIPGRFCFRKTSGETGEKNGISVLDLTRFHSHRTMKQEGRFGFGPIRGRTAGTERRKDTFPAEICTEEAERCSI